MKMKNYRDTYALINLNNIKENVSKIVNYYNEYEYYFGVVKADCYGHGLNSIKAIIDGGCNYLAVATLDEALEIRNSYKDIPILCLGVVSIDYLNICDQNNITITISSKEYVDEVIKNDYNNLKVHIKINSGMNRLGIDSNNDLKYIINKLDSKNIYVEGIYTHIYNASDEFDTKKQFEQYEKIIGDINKEKIRIFHVAASETLVSYPKLSFVNGCRLGIIMYGFSNNNLDLKSTFSLHSKIIQINELNEGDKLGYNGAYVAKEKEKIGVVCIGYADGIIRKNTNRSVYINGKEYYIVGNICMDMLFVKVDDFVNVNDEVIILKDNNHIEEVASHLETIPYEILCSISKRVPRICKE